MDNFIFVEMLLFTHIKVKLLHTLTELVMKFMAYPLTLSVKFLYMYSGSITFI